MLAIIAQKGNSHYSVCAGLKISPSMKLDIWIQYSDHKSGCCVGWKYLTGLDQNN
jgi:hypothetical protein